MKIKISTLLMEAGVSYNKQRLHKAGYFCELLATSPCALGKRKVHWCDRWSAIRCCCNAWNGS